MSSLVFLGQQISIYFGIVTLIAGVIGGILNTIVFLTLQTFRQNSCAFYLLVMSMVNVGTLISSQLTRILISGFAIDWTQTSLFYCKFRIYLLQICSLVSITCICLSIIDQYMSTSSRLRCQQWSNIKVAHRLISLIIPFWILSNIPYLIYYTHILSPTTGKVTCTTINSIFQQYFNVAAITFTGVLPVIIVGLFGLLAYINIHQLAHQTLPHVRRELDKQLTVMVLAHGLLTFLTIAPQIIIYFLSLIPTLVQNPPIAIHLQFLASLTSSIVYIYFASPFYIYICASARFRRQLKYVLFDIHFNQCHPRPILPNQVAPHLS